MEIEQLRKNTEVVHREMRWFEQVTDAALKLYFEQETEVTDVFHIQPPALSGLDVPYAQVVSGFRMEFLERYVLILSLIPHVRPQLLDVFFTKNADYDRGFTEFGGLRGQYHGGFLPTGETAAFVLAGNDLMRRLAVQSVFHPGHYFKRTGMVKLAATKEEPELSGALHVSDEYQNYLLRGEGYIPTYNADFPAKPLHTPLEWEDLVLDSMTMGHVMEIRAWIKHQQTLMEEWGLHRLLKPGFKCLFYGPPGTGKTLTASLLGKVSGFEVLRVDLSMVVSKYIGETEKNLANVFDQAENRNWVLFFDEADALFGKRTQGNSANERYANQEVAYLLQRIEDFPGLVVLATNLESNIDEAFMRRFHSTVQFPLPEFEQRVSLWEQKFGSYVLDKDRPYLRTVAKKYELAGGALVNILRHGAILAAEDNRTNIEPEEILSGIRREYEKMGKRMPE